MFRRLIAALAASLFATAFAADVNTASQADLEAVRGIGPPLAARILDARRNGEFTDWPDLVARVKGIGPASAARLSAQGLTVDGTTWPARIAPAASAPFAAAPASSGASAAPSPRAAGKPATAVH